MIPPLVCVYMCTCMCVCSRKKAKVCLHAYKTANIGLAILADVYDLAKFWEVGHKRSLSLSLPVLSHCPSGFFFFHLCLSLSLFLFISLSCAHPRAAQELIATETMKATPISECILHATQSERQIYFHRGLSGILNLEPATAPHLSLFGTGREEAGDINRYWYESSEWQPVWQPFIGLKMEPESSGN